MFQRMLIKKMLGKQLEGVPDNQVDVILDLVEKNPELFKRIAKEIKTRVDQGEDQMSVTQSVMTLYQSELRDALGK